MKDLANKCNHVLHFKVIKFLIELTNRQNSTGFFQLKGRIKNN